MSDVPLNLLSVSTNVHTLGTSFRAATRSISEYFGLRKLGARLVVLEPGQKAWPRHYHINNDELFVVLQGAGTCSSDDVVSPLKEHDVIGFPAGATGAAHQIEAGPDGLSYLAVSSMLEPDIVIYPNSQKFAVFAGSAPGGDPIDRTFTHIGSLNEALDYLDGEEP
ncbi:cupin domain-containing protein [uncultured Litoreibacter sp.]|uniref:cupin domain-containing protein n=1 Tax=uncultured Litoreibacter sp. TaxID=1392394 RepID=UPI00262D4057|nr:cupin domain-containing protein [uncultured Litoreibacter sp.]